MPKAELVNVSIKPDDWKLLLRCAGDLKGWRTAHVHPLTRYGFSGARIYVVEPKRGENGIPHVVKIAEPVDVRKEVKGLSIARVSFNGVPAHQEYKISGLHAISFPLFTTDDAFNVMDGADVYSSCFEGKMQAEETLHPMLTRAMALMARSHQPIGGQRARNLGRVVHRYLREERVSRVERIFSQGGLAVCGHEVVESPLRYLEVVKKMQTRGFICGAIHGDFHLSNLVADGAVVTPALIDYAWTKVHAHGLLDFVMMESSLRFMKFPRMLNPGLLLSVDRALNESLFTDEATRIARTVNDAPSRNALLTMLGAVGVVRRAMLSAFNQVEMRTLHQEYVRVFYLLLSGQEKFPDYPLLRTAINLEHLGELSMS